MGIMEEWGDALVQETLREAADMFFGVRREAEDEIALFLSRVADLRLQAEKIHPWRAALSALLGPAGSSEFADMLSAPMPVSTVSEEARPPLLRLRGFTRKGLFVKTAWHIYTVLSGMIDTYMHGAPCTDPSRPGHTLTTIHYEQLQRHCAALNERIARVNESNRPSESLAFAKRMDQNLMQKESITGGGEGSTSLDGELAFSAVDFDACGLPFFPDLPTDGAAKKRFRNLCATIFTRDPSRAKDALAKLMSE